MPTYEYHCNACEKDFEAFHSMTADPVKDCPECDVTGKVERKISAGAGIIFKGSGFYETDYKTKSGTPESSSSAKTESKPSGHSCGSGCGCA